MALVKCLLLLCAGMTHLLEICTDVIGVILNKLSWEIIPLITTLKWAPWDHLLLKSRHGLLASYSLLSRALDHPQIWTVTPEGDHPVGPTSCQRLWSHTNLCLWPFTLKPVEVDGGLYRPPCLVILGTMLWMFSSVSFLGFYRKVLQGLYFNDLQRMRQVHLGLVN